jgi:hypothetical protein
MSKSEYRTNAAESFRHILLERTQTRSDPKSKASYKESQSRRFRKDEGAEIDGGLPGYRTPVTSYQAKGMQKSSKACSSAERRSVARTLSSSSLDRLSQSRALSDQGTKKARKKVRRYHNPRLLLLVGRDWIQDRV